MLCITVFCNGPVKQKLKQATLYVPIKNLIKAVEKILDFYPVSIQKSFMYSNRIKRMPSNFVSLDY